MRPETRYARNGDVSLAYQVVGSGRPDLLYLPGFFSHADYFWEISSTAQFLERLASFSRLILMDRRGSGLSDRLGHDPPPPLETLVGDVRCVLDAAASDRTALIGLWDGSHLASMFAAIYPERTSALVLYCASARGRRRDDYPFNWTDEEWEAWLASIRGGWGTTEWIEEHCRWTYPEILDDPELPKWKLAYRMAASPASAEALMRLYSETDIRDLLPTIHVPTLILHKLDDQTEYVEGARYIAERIPDARIVEVPGRNTPPWSEDPELVLEPIQEFLTGTRPARESTRVLATVLFTDIVRSTEMAARLGDHKWRRVLMEHHELIRRQLDRHRGREIDTAGDGFFATFEGPAAAVHCANAIVEEVRGLGLEIRAGVHTGECELTKEGIGGLAVHIGARVLARAEPSEVLVTSTVKDLVVGSGLRFEDRGEQELKGVPDRWHLYALAA